MELEDMNLEEVITKMELIKKNYEKYAPKQGYDEGIQRDMLLKYGELYYYAIRIGLGHQHKAYGELKNWYIQKEGCEGL